MPWEPNQEVINRLYPNCERCGVALTDENRSLFDPMCEPCWGKEVSDSWFDMLRALPWPDDEGDPRQHSLSKPEKS